MSGIVGFCILIVTGFALAITIILSGRIVDLDRRVTKLEHHVHVLERP